VFSWGWNYSGQIGHGDKVNRNTPEIIKFFKDKQIIHVYCLSYSSIVLSKSGSVYSFGWNYSGQIGIGNTTHQTTPQEITYFKNIPISKIYCGYHHSFAISQSNKVYCWGWNNKGQLGVEDNKNRLTPEEHKYFSRKPIIQCSLGYNHSIVLVEKFKPKSFIIQLKRKDNIDIKFQIHK
jgi:alpha-tubulin suppressor-like RCC1 family protein